MHETLIIFLQGILTFVAPCMLPMLPLYFIYLSGGVQSNNIKKTLISLIGFIFGFTIIFVALGASASQLGHFLGQHQGQLTFILGFVVLLIGINFIFPLKTTFDKIVQSLTSKNKNHSSENEVQSMTAETKLSFKERALRRQKKDPGFISSTLFGMAFASSWSACISANLAYALSLAASRASLLHGVYLLTVFSLGLALPFLLFGLFFSRLKNALHFLQKYSRHLQIFSGILMIIIALAMLTGYFDLYLSLFNH